MENKRLNYSTVDSYKTYFNMFVFQVVIYLAFSMILSVICIANNAEVDDIVGSSNYIYIAALMSPAVFCLLFFWQNRRKKYETREILGLKKKIEWKYVLFAVFIGIMCITCFSSISNLFDFSLEYIGFNPDDNINVRTDNIGFLLLNILVLAVLPAIFEDLIFRGVIFCGFRSENSSRFAVIMSALLFAIMHGSLQQTFYQFVIGIILALVMLKTGNIIYPIITHMTNNVIVIISHYFATRAGTVTADAIWSFNEIFVAILLAVLGVIGCVIIFKYVLNSKDDNSVIAQSKSFLRYNIEEKFYAVGGILIAAISWISTTISMWG